MHSVSYFISGNTQKGFVSLLPEIYCSHEGWRYFLLTGGSDERISSLLHKTADAADRHGFKTECMPCSFDPVRLEAVFLPEMKKIVINGNIFQHAVLTDNIDKKQVDLSFSLDPDFINACIPVMRKLKLKKEEAYEKSRKNLKAASIIEREIHDTYIHHLHKDKINRFVKRISENYLTGYRESESRGEVRFLSAVTPIGIVVEYETLFSQCDTVIALEDDYGVASDCILQSVQAELNRRGIDYQRYLCALTPLTKTEHLIIPDLRLGFFTSNAFHPILGKPTKKIHAKRFMEENHLKHSKNKFRFLRKAKTELIGDAMQYLEIAKIYHEIIQTYITAAEKKEIMQETEEEILRDILPECFT